MKVLECSSKGDRRFSAFFARVAVNGFVDSIENFYQLSKRFIQNGVIQKPRTWKDAKGKAPNFFVIRDKEFPMEYFSMWYKLLWVKYLDINPELVAYASEFDEFTDMFKGKNTLNCQADVVREYIKEGRRKVMQDCIPLLALLEEKSFIMEAKGDLLKSKEQIIAHQVNCLGAMGKGIASQIHDQFPNVYEDYRLLCKQYINTRYLMGQCYVVQIERQSRYVANLFGQYETGQNVRRTEYDYLRKALIDLKTYAQENNLSVGLPYGLGCGLAGGDWRVVHSMISEVFNDYPVTIYKFEKENKYEQKQSHGEMCPSLFPENAG